MQPLGVRLGAGGERLRGLLGRSRTMRPATRRRAMTPGRTVVTPLSTAVARRPDPVLRAGHGDGVPAGDFVATAVPNDRLRTDMVPARGATWGQIEEFALTYDGYRYWSDVAELGNRSLQRWTRDQTLPAGLDELRGSLFYEQRRWHHFGEEPHGRGAEYVWALIDAIRQSETLPHASVAPPSPPVAAMPAPPVLPAPPLVPPPPAPSPKTIGAAGPRTNPKAADEVTVDSFLDDDDAYRAWVDDHAEGFVVNAARTGAGKGLKLHKASCSSVLTPSGTGRSLTARYRKVCASDVRALLEWCATSLAAEPDPCLRCRP